MLDIENKLTPAARELYENLKKTSGKEMAERVLRLAWAECVNNGLSQIPADELLDAAKAYGAKQVSGEEHGNTFPLPIEEKLAWIGRTHGAFVRERVANRLIVLTGGKLETLTVSDAEQALEKVFESGPKEMPNAFGNLDTHQR